MSKNACGLCGEDPARGLALVGDVRYCHGDFDPDPTCYMQAQRFAYDVWDYENALVPDE